MTTAKPELEAIQARLRTLERRVRWSQLAVVLVLTLAGAGLLMGGNAPTPGRGLDGERFSLRDATGRERAWLGLEHGEPVLRFLGAKGEERASLALADQGVVLRVLDAREKLQSGMSLTNRGIALVTFDPKGQSLVGQNALTNEIETIVRRRARWGNP